MRESLAIDVAGSIRSGRVIEVLNGPVGVHRRPRQLRSDNDTESASWAVLKWPPQANIDTAHIDPDKPWQNEFFKRQSRDECLSMEWFGDRIASKIVIEQCRRRYSRIGPRSSLGRLTPVEFRRRLIAVTSPETAIS